jgi:hypothetical protein
MDDQGQDLSRDSHSGSGPERGPARARAVELGAARRRARVAKTVFGAGAALIFGISAVFARHSDPGHPKGSAVPLGAPRSFVDAVHRSVLQGGAIAPPQAPPSASTSVS